jgi:hypothetical protein
MQASKVIYLHLILYAAIASNIICFSRFNSLALASNIRCFPRCRLLVRHLILYAFPIPSPLPSRRGRTIVLPRDPISLHLLLPVLSVMSLYTLSVPELFLQFELGRRGRPVSGLYDYLRGLHPHASILIVPVANADQGIAVDVQQLFGPLLSRPELQSRRHQFLRPILKILLLGTTHLPAKIYVNIYGM